ncbi:hypothetical protein QCA50_001613 [Cerrena zonata]|uniref:F-box domain-containing protein n=1 Tax=Cerrena zonata TaxID=2478898 RepID=A0AAW0GR93_9APHY
MELNYDVLIHVFDSLEETEFYPTLFACSLVNRVFNDAASRLLYRKVVLEPEPTNVLRLGRRDQQLNGLFTSARLPHNRQHVLDVRIAGFLEDRPPPMNRFPQTLSEALREWTNLRSFALTPYRYPQELILTTFETLPQCLSLRDLTVNASCCSEEAVPLLVRICSLENLTIESPGRAILNLMPEWLNRLSSTLTGFHLKDNCGSVTPGVLRSFIPFGSRIRTFALGLSYSLTHQDVFDFLPHLPNLQKLDIQYYQQLRKLSTKPPLPNLQSLTIRHTHITETPDAAYLIKFVHHLSRSSPLEELYLIADSYEIRGPCVSFDGLVKHLIARHAATLRVLYMPTAYLSLAITQELCTRCPQMEELAIACHDHILVQYSPIMYHIQEPYLVCIGY